MKKEIIYNKLVRDLIPDIIRDSGKSYEIHIAEEKEYISKLLSKLNEETLEFLENPCEEEIADILEVIDAIIKYYNFSSEKINKIKIEKGNSRGKFNKRIILEKVKEK